MKKIVVILACSIVSCTTLFAQAPLKLGWIESAELLNSMPEKAKADTEIAHYAKDFQSQIDIMIKEYQSKGQAFQAGEKTMTEAMKEVKMKEIQDLQGRIESTQQSAQEKLQQKKQDVYAPILEKADKAIKEVAREKSYDYIFDKSGGVLLFAKDGDNILPLVKAKLGIK